MLFATFGRESQSLTVGFHQQNALEAVVIRIAYDDLTDDERDKQSDTPRRCGPGYDPPGSDCATPIPAAVRLQFKGERSVCLPWQAPSRTGTETTGSSYVHYVVVAPGGLHGVR